MFFHRFEIRWDDETGITEGAIARLGERGDRFWFNIEIVVEPDIDQDD
jgi:hypothetical protein